MNENNVISRREQKKRTRERLFKVALRQFTRKGFKATRTYDIALAAGVSHGTVFVHFATRDELITKVVDEFSAEIIKRLHQHVEEGAGVRKILAVHLKVLSEYEAFYTRLIAERQLLPKNAQNSLLGFQSVISTLFAAAAEREAKKGKMRAVPIHLFFNTWIGLVHYYLGNRDLFAPGRSVIREKGEELLNHYMSLLKTDLGKGDKK